MTESPKHKSSIMYPAEVTLIGLDGKFKKMTIYFTTPADRSEYVTLMNKSINLIDKLSNALIFMGAKY